MNPEESSLGRITVRPHPLAINSNENNSLCCDDEEEEEDELRKQSQRGDRQMVYKVFLARSISPGIIRGSFSVDQILEEIYYIYIYILLIFKSFSIFKDLINLQLSRMDSLE